MVASSWLRLLALPALGVILGCAGASNPGRGDGPSVSSDLAGPGGRDLAQPPGSDLAVGPGADLAGPRQDLATPADGAGGDALQGDLAEAPDLLPMGKGPGEYCDQDAECGARLCKAIIPGFKKVCVTPCKVQNDCNFNDLFCHPTKAGAADGYCVPRSAMHCASCTKDDDCGILGERCLKGPGDVAAACHVDCAIAGAAACPPDYECKDVMDGNDQRKLCRPKGGVCLDAVGGYCDRVQIPQACTRLNMAGSCTGQRPCMPSMRYDKCGAIAPQFKKDCTEMDPAGCMLQYAPAAISNKQNCGACGKACAQAEDCCNMVCTKVDQPQSCGACGKACAQGQGCCNAACSALDTVQACGACGKVCPGVGQATGEASCANQTCRFTCKGENYDVDNNAGNGCERNHGNSPGHTQGAASDLGSVGCDDGSKTTFQGVLYSDSRTHVNPTVDGFVAKVGSAPDFWKIVGTGKSNVFPFVCINNYNVTITTTGGGNQLCYQLTLSSDKTTKTMTVSGAGSASMSSDNPIQYGSGSTVSFKIEKICDLPVQEGISYKVTFSL